MLSTSCWQLFRASCRTITPMRSLVLEHAITSCLRRSINLNIPLRSMSSKPSPVPAEDLESFKQHLRSSKRVLALLGAGLSASSGLPTFRGAGGLWRTHDAMSLATPGAFSRDPGLVWQFYSYRRHMAMQAQPNRAHLALAELARRMDGFMALSQNVDG